jgi:hypothetical protein
MAGSSVHEATMPSRAKTVDYAGGNHCLTFTAGTRILAPIHRVEMSGGFGGPGQVSAGCGHAAASATRSVISPPGINDEICSLDGMMPIPHGKQHEVATRLHRN